MKPVIALALALFVTAVPMAQSPAGMLAPTRVLRAVFVADNAALGKVDPTTKMVSGVVADVVDELARRMSVPFELRGLANTNAVINNLNRGNADIGFLAFDETRAKDISFGTTLIVANGVNQQVVVSKFTLERLEIANLFVNNLIADGVVKASVDRAGLKDVTLPK